MASWLERLPALSTVANYTELLGFLITLIGFAVGIYKLREIRSEAERGHRTMRETLERVGKSLLLSNVSTAARLALELRSLARDRNWNRAIDRGDQLRSLLAAASQDTALTENDRKSVGTAVDDIGLIVRLCEKGMSAGAPYTLPAKTTTALDEIIADLARLDGRLKNVSVELHHG